MKWRNLDSKAITRYCYGRHQLIIEFSWGGRYLFSGVPGWVSIELRNHPSPGTFYHQQIKGKYGEAERIK